MLKKNGRPQLLEPIENRPDVTPRGLITPKKVKNPWLGLGNFPANPATCGNLSAGFTGWLENLRSRKVTTLGSIQNEIQALFTEQNSS